MLDSVERRSSTGKRDYALLLLLVSYGLRAREVAALTLDDIDWERDRLLVPERKAGHCTAYPLSRIVGHGSPQSTEIYTKVDVEKLRTMALSDGEELL